MEEYAAVFTEHANKLVEVANLACSMSANEDGVKMVRYAAAQIENLCPQVRSLFFFWEFYLASGWGYEYHITLKQLGEQ